MEDVGRKEEGTQRGSDRRREEGYRATSFLHPTKGDDGNYAPPKCREASATGAGIHGSIDFDFYKFLSALNN